MALLKSVVIVASVLVVVSCVSAIDTAKLKHRTHTRLRTSTSANVNALERAAAGARSLQSDCIALKAAVAESQKTLNAKKDVDAQVAADAVAPFGRQCFAHSTTTVTVANAPNTPPAFDDWFKAHPTTSDVFTELVAEFKAAGAPDWFMQGKPLTHQVLPINKMALLKYGALNALPAKWLKKTPVEPPLNPNWGELELTGTDLTNYMAARAGTDAEYPYVCRAGHVLLPPFMQPNLASAYFKLVIRRIWLQRTEIGVLMPNLNVNKNFDSLKTAWNDWRLTKKTNAANNEKNDWEFTFDDAFRVWFIAVTAHEIGHHFDCMKSEWAPFTAGKTRINDVLTVDGDSCHWFGETSAIQFEIGMIHWLYANHKVPKAWINAYLSLNFALRHIVPQKFQGYSGLELCLTDLGSKCYGKLADARDFETPWKVTKAKAWLMDNTGAGFGWNRKTKNERKRVLKAALRDNNDKPINAELEEHLNRYTYETAYAHQSESAALQTFVMARYMDFRDEQGIIWMNLRLDHLLEKRFGDEFFKKNRLSWETLKADSYVSNDPYHTVLQTQLDNCVKLLQCQ